MSTFAVKSSLIEAIVEKETKILAVLYTRNHHRSSNERSALVLRERFEQRRKWWTKSVSELTKRLEWLGAMTQREILEFAD